jgi:hypothetical protein
MDCRARWLLPTLEILWGSCTFAQSRVRNVHQLYALRFLVGMFEAPVFAETHFILGKFQLWSLLDTSLTGQIRLLVLRLRPIQSRRDLVHLQST